jgi:serine/threonine protein kinase
MQFQYLGNNNRYEVHDPIGRGSMFMIYRGRDTVLNREAAIKVLRDIYSRDPKFVTRFQRVARAMMALRHPNIVQVYEYGQTNGTYFIVMELIEGTDLRRYQRSRGVLDTERAVIIGHDVALGLGAMHKQGLVHRAISPRNVLVGRDGSIKLTGLSFASINLHDEQDDMGGMSLNAINYYAPEVAQGEMVSPAADVYALGAIMYELLTGNTPFDSDTPVAVAMQHIHDAPVPPSQYNPGIPPDVEKVILRCMEKVPEMRYADGLQLARALESL